MSLVPSLTPPAALPSQGSYFPSLHPQSLSPSVDSQATEIVDVPEMTEDVAVLRQMIQRFRFQEGELRAAYSASRQQVEGLLARVAHLEALLAAANLPVTQLTPTLQQTPEVATLAADSGVGSQQV